MKKFTPIILIIIAILGIWFVFKQASNVSTKSETSSTNDSVAHPNPSNATFTFEDGPITLSKGQNEQQIIPGGELTQDTTLTSTIGYGDLNNDKKEDAAVVLVQSGGGSGVFVYVAAYVSGPLDYKGSNAVFVGDRINPKSISINNGIISFNYLDRKSNEPFATEPSVPITKQFVYSNGTLAEKK